LRSYRPYTTLPVQDRASIQDEFIAQRARSGGDLPNLRTAEELRATAARSGIDVPITADRVKKTKDAIAEFVRYEGREPKTKADWARIFNRTTLALPPLALIGAGGSSDNDEKIRRAERAAAAMNN